MTRDELLTPQEAADRLRTGIRFVRRLIAERRVRFTHVGRHVRIYSSSLEELITQGTVEPIRPASAWQNRRAA